MTLLWAIVYLIVAALSDGKPPQIEFWNAWAITLVIAVAVDIL